MLSGALIVLAAQTAALTPPPSASSAVLAAVEFCGRVAQGTGGKAPGEFYMTAKGATSQAYRRMGMKTDADVPDLIKRFAATTVTGRTSAVSDFVKIPSQDGDVWIVVGRGPVCDAMVTNSNGTANFPGTVLSELQSNQGWTLRMKSDATASSPLWAAVLTKSVPAKDAPQYGMRLRVQGLTKEFAKPDGVQLEINLAAGDIQSRAPSSAAQ